jgi:hypothetical protein
MPNVGDKIKRTNALKVPDAPTWEIVDQKGGWYHCKNLKSGKIEKVPTTALKSFSVVNESTLKTLARLLREAKDDEVKEDGEDSLDMQVDKYFSEYEAEAKNAKNEGLDLRTITRRIMSEADEDEKEDDSEEPAAEEGADAEPEPEKLTIEDIDVGSFVTDVMRLVDNYDSLLEVRNTVLRRAVNFLNKTYEKDVADSFKEQLIESYGVEIGKSKFEQEDEEFPAPKAGAAGPAGSGGGA